MSKFLSEIGVKVMDIIPKSMGAKGHFTIPKRQLLELAAQEETGAATRIIEGLQNPNLEVAYKAQSNYSIAAINLRDGQRSVAKGAVSVVNPGEEAIVKTRISVGENGEVMQANGFVDAGKYPDVNDSAVNVAKKNGVITAAGRVGDAFGGNARIDTAKAEGILEQIPNGERAIMNYRDSMTDLATSANRIMQQVKDAFAGRSPKPSLEKVLVPKVAEIKAEKPLSAEELKDLAKKFKDTSVTGKAINENSYDSFIGKL